MKDSKNYRRKRGKEHLKNYKNSAAKLMNMKSILGNRVTPNMLPRNVFGD